jgi:hypothetical protein
MTFTLFRLLKYIVSLLKHFKIFLNETKLELDIRTFSWKLFDKATISTINLYFHRKITPISS